MLTKSLKALLVASIVMLNGCSTTFIEDLIPESDANYEEMYVRGVFTWWEADENYRLKQIGDNLFAANAKLIADGQPYDFKFADENWTPGMSCGSASGQSSVQLSLADKLLANCDNPQGNFQFTPTETGTYSFVIDFTDAANPIVFVQRSE